MSKALANKLVRIRKQLDMNQGELAAALGVTQSAVSIWERNKGEPKRHNLVALAELADIPLVHLMDEKEMNKQIEISGIVHTNGKVADSRVGSIDTVIAAPDGVQAFRIEDDSMAPFKKGWLLIVAGNREALNPEDVDELCVVGMAGHGRRVGYVRKDRSTDSHWIEPLGVGAQPIFNPTITYAHPVIAIQTR